MNETVSVIFTRHYGQWSPGEIITFPKNIADTIVSMGAAKVNNPVIPTDRKTTETKMIRKAKTKKSK